MELKLQDRLNKIFEFNKSDRNIQYLKSLDLDNIINFTNEVIMIHNKLSELSAKNRNLISRIYINLYRTVQAERERQDLDKSPEGSEGEVIKTK
jgi:hypothetical protein